MIRTQKMEELVRVVVVVARGWFNLTAETLPQPEQRAPTVGCRSSRCAVDDQ